GMPGDWIWVSASLTRRPCASSSVVRFAVVLDFPVPPRNEWIDTICAILSSPGLLVLGELRRLRRHWNAPHREHRDIVELVRLGDVAAYARIDAVDQADGRWRGLDEQREQALLSVQLAGGVARVWHAVGESEQDIARVELRLLDAEFRIGHHTDSRASGVQPFTHSILANNCRQLVPTVDIHQRAART